MRSPARLSLALLGLALVLPAPSLAGPYDSEAAPKHHKGLFRACKCVECQRARVKARDGVDVPAPPPVPPNIVAVGDGRKGLFGRGKGEYCEACEQGTTVGGPIMIAGDAPGYAVVGEPSPIGTVTGPAANRGALAGRRGQKDPSVATTEFAAPTPLGGPGHNRPHLITHMFHLDTIGRRSGQERERRHREKHASIAYGPQDTAPVTELPASVVYRRSR